MAQKWHPNNDRRVRRSLEIFHQTGKRHSEWLKDQKLANDNNESATVSGHASPTNIIGNNDLDALKSNGGSVSALRYNTLFFWLFANQDVLDARLDRRVDSMLQQGLLEEIKDMREKCKRGEILGALVKPAGVPSTTITTTTTTTCAADDTAIVEFDYTRGLLQAIGFKEFHVYLSKLEQEGSGSISSSPSQLHSALFAAGVEEMKAATRRYARRQIQWIRNKLFGKIRNQMEQLEKQQLREVYNNTQAGIQIYTKNDTIANLCRRRLGFYVLDATSLDTWEDMVEKRGVQVSDEFISMCCEGSITSLPDPAVIAPLVYTQLESSK